MGWDVVEGLFDVSKEFGKFMSGLSGTFVTSNDQYG